MKSSRSARSKVSPARRIALAALLRIARGQFSRDALNAAVKERNGPVQAADRALATELTYGVLRRRGTLDYYLAHLSRRPLKDLDPALLQILRMAAYELLYLDRVPQRAAVHQGVELARRAVGPGAAGFANGILRNLQRRRDEILLPDPQEDPVGHLMAAHSHPRFLARRYLDRFSWDEAVALCRANNTPRPLTIRVNALRTGREEVARRLAAAGIDVNPGRWLPEALQLGGTKGRTPDGLPGFAQGHFTFQDEASMLVSKVVNPRPGEKVLDACSAPGTKTTHLAELMADEGHLLAVDISKARLAEVTKGARRLRLNIITAQRADARELGRQYPEAFDKVLVDAPCSGLGTLAGRPDLRWQKGEEAILALAFLQQQILASVAATVKPGGILVYSTCTTEQEENQQVVADFLAAHKNFQPLPLADLLPAPLVSAAQGHQLQLWPHRHGTAGFFIARLQRLP